MLPGLVGLPDGVTEVGRVPGGAALDYIRGNLFDREDMRALPAAEPGPDNDLADRCRPGPSRPARPCASRCNYRPNSATAVA